MNRTFQLVAIVGVGAVFMTPTVTPAQLVKKRTAPAAGARTGPAQTPVNPDVFVKSVLDKALPDLPDIEADDPLVVEYLPRFRQLTRAEIRFVQTVCELSEPQRDAINAEGSAVSLTAAMKYAESRKKWSGGARGLMAVRDPRRLVQEGLAATLKSRLTADQSDDLCKEMEERLSDLKRATIRNLIEQLDDKLTLGDGQKQRLTVALGDHWRDSWAQFLDAKLIDGNAYFPNIPTAYLRPILSQEQYFVWQRLTKIGNPYWGHSLAFGQIPGQTVQAADEDDFP